MQARLAVDIGGTFTDVALFATGSTHITKVLTTHAAPEQGFLNGMRDVLAQAGLKPKSLEFIVHGTTLATNAIIERRGARTGLLTTAGYRDVLEIADEGRFDQYDLKIVKPEPLVPRSLRFAAEERLAADGEVLRPLDEAQVRSAAEAFAKARVESVAVGFLHAYRNPVHEQRAAAILAEALPDVPISLSSDVCPEIREYERVSTTCANAYVRPIMEGYLGRLEAELRQMGASCPLLLMTSGGGLASVETARRLPIRLVESGPAGGAILASQIARELGYRRVVSFDMGGTTAKITLVEDFEPESARAFEVARTARFRKGSGLPLRIPVIEMIEIGAGGGSIAHRDRLGGVTVGPESAESEPGPACYGRGGTLPTVTDADLALGRIQADRFAGGRMGLRGDLSLQALGELGEPLGLSPLNAAYAVCETIDETMTNAARVYAVERGRDLADHTMIAFGGAAPLHAARMAEKLRVSRVVIPRNAGVGSALGFMCAPIGYETVRSHQMRLSEFDPQALNGVFEALRAEALEAIRSVPGVDPATCREVRSAFMRYLGQGHEVAAALPVRDFEPRDADEFKRSFEARYREAYKRTLPETDIELLTLSLRLEAPNSLTLAVVNAAPKAPSVAADGNASVFLPDRMAMAEVPVLDRSGLKAGTPVSGPCIITEPTTTTFVTAAFNVEADAEGNLILIQKNP